MSATTPPAFILDSLVPYDDQAEIEVAARAVSANTMATFPALAVTYRIAAYCESAGVDGAFVECGVWKGGCTGVMALANLVRGQARRDLHLFDSFKDCAEPDERIDGAHAIAEARQLTGITEPFTGRLKPLTGGYDSMGGHGTVEACGALLSGMGYDRDRVHFHVGWFQETLPEAAAGIGDVAVLRLDGDFYAATKVCLEHLYDAVVPGGFVIIDDYGMYDGCRHAVDEFLATLAQPPFLHHANAAVRYLQKR